MGKVLKFMWVAAVALSAFSTMSAQAQIEDQLQTEGPALPEVWRTSYPELTVSPQYVSAGTDGRFVFALDGRLARVDAQTGRQDWRIDTFLESGQTLGLHMLKLKPMFIVTGFERGGGLGSIQIRSYPSGDTVRTIRESFSGGILTISANEEYVAKAYRGTVMAWSISTGEQVWKKEGDGISRFATCWTRDSTRLITTTVINDLWREVSCWDVENDRLVWTKTITGNTSLFFGQISGDGKRIIFHWKERGEVEVREFPSLDLVYSNDSSSTTIIPSYDGRYLLAGGTRKPYIHMVDVENGATRVIDTNYLAVFPSHSDEFIYAAKYDELRKLRFDWTTSVAAPATPIIRAFFPNPCGAQGTFEYDVPGEQDVNLVLYDLNGHQVRHLSSGVQSGPQHVPFDCGSLVPGVYHCVLYLGGQTFSQQVQIGGE